MIYINNNEKLADLLEDLLKKDVSNTTIIDAKDLIVELRSSDSEVVLLDKEALNKKHRKYIAENK
jgi:hypothetical protein